MASTWKALAIASAVPLTEYPDPRHGYGFFSAQRAVEVIEADNDGRTAGTSARIFQFLLAETGVVEFKIHQDLQAGETYRVVLCWSDPKGPILPASLEPTTRVLTNDIDLRVIDPDGTEHEPWRFVTQPQPPDPDTLVVETGDNTVDNVEVVTVGQRFGEDSTVRIAHRIDKDPIEPNPLLNGDPQLVSVVIFGDAEAVLHPEFRITHFFLGGIEYLGLEFDISGATHYGWVEVESREFFQFVRVHRWAYESEPGVGIFAGQIPEPSEAALLITGLVLACWRRRRSD